MNNQILRAILEKTSDSIIMLGLDLKITYINNTAQKMYDLLNGEQMEVGVDVREYLNPKCGGLILDANQKVLAGQSAELELLMTYKKTERWLKHQLPPIYDAEGKVWATLWIIQDIHHQKQAEIKLEESEAKFSSIFHSAPVTILIVDSNMCIVDANPETKNLFHYDLGELIGESINVLIPRRFWESHEVSLLTYTSNPTPYKLGTGRVFPALTKEGKEIFTEISLNNFILAGKKYFVALIQDVTQRIEHESIIESQVTQLQDIAWYQAHKVRSPLAKILGLVNLFQTEKDEEYKTLYLQYLKESADELDAVIHKVINDVYTKDLISKI
ncbi:PAS domain S-box-containing protein [Flexibacter flexilis DSM 6793]|uniref:PAS domain S-box-containing protein n=1 Tax=Flexibacter flexilis DSM 6793 TaxID=927664 RepID=A0A1I1EEB6_9BACT|nr:PAS domain-containing protein [Flexibacter flexilis]SFB83300.1 PAS domain S-box-containing protein [Flexibacter flexilis DSM 6793]